MAYITTEEVKAIRVALKNEFGKAIKFSVTRRHMSSVNIAILESKQDFREALGPNGRTDCSVGEYHMDEHPEANKKVYEKIYDIARNAPIVAGLAAEWHDRSDAMTDYFEISYYINVSVGTWAKPYKFLA
jgi:hypothetical protein